MGSSFEVELRRRITDLSVMSFIQIVAAVSRDRQLAVHREHPMLLARLGNSRVRLGFGLHLGWSIEGAIGSEFKIDASYLSPDVNMATSLEAATKHYGVTVLMSEALVRTCTPELSRNLRPVDRVRFQGAKLPTRLFTVDLDGEALAPWAEDVSMATRRASFSSHVSPTRIGGLCSAYTAQAGAEQHRLDETKLGKLSDAYQVHEVLARDVHLQRMRAAYPIEFFQAFETGYLNYEAGEWDVASQLFQRTKDMLRCGHGAHSIVDGPSSVLLAYMRGFNCAAPADWPGFFDYVPEDNKRRIHGPQWSYQSCLD
jgi:hypothetical protein